MRTQLRGSPLPEKLNGTSFSLLARGYRGEVTKRDSTASTRLNITSSSLLGAAADADIEVLAQLDIALIPGANQQAGNRSLGNQNAQLIVPARSGNRYAVLQTDESGQSTWLFPQDELSEQVTFVLRASANAPTEGVRGVVTATMRSLVSVVAWSAGPLIAKAAKALAANWEARRRPYHLYQVKDDGTFVTVDWSGFGPGPALLLIHGTFSTPQAGFDGWLGTAAYQSLVKRYAGRVLALAHPSLSASAQENVDWLIQQLPAHVVSDNVFDIVCHSRGGLVARALADSNGVGPRISRACLVGTPNRGTPLADVQHWMSFINAHTSCLTMLPDTSATVFLEGILCLVKVIGSGLAGGMPGLVIMDPENPWLHEKTTTNNSTSWYTVGAVYRVDSSSEGLLTRLNSALIESFYAAGNDLVVPSDGCHQPIQEPTDSLFLNGNQTNHCNYFKSVEVHERLADWLK